MHYTLLASALLAALTSAAPQVAPSSTTSTSSTSTSTYTSLPTSDYPDPSTIQPSTPLETALVDYVCSTYYEWYYDDDCEDGYSDYSRVKAREAKKAKKEKMVKRQASSSTSTSTSSAPSATSSSSSYYDDSDDSDDYDYDSDPYWDSEYTYDDYDVSYEIGEALVEVLCANFDTSAFEDSSDTDYKGKRSVSGKKEGKARKLRARKAGRKAVKPRARN